MAATADRLTSGEGLLEVLRAYGVEYVFSSPGSEWPAVWDVLAAGEREGSLDSAIVRASMVVNDFSAFFERHRQVRLICFNGNTAGRAEPAWAAAGYETLVLPSTSPAYTRPFAEKLAAWRRLRRFLDER